MTAALVSIRKHQTRIRVDTGGPKQTEGIYSGARDGVLFVWPAPSRRIPFDAIDTLYARRSKASRPAVIIGAVIGGAVLGTINSWYPDPSPLSAFAVGGLLGGFIGYRSSSGGSPWEVIYARPESGG